MTSHVEVGREQLSNGDTLRITKRGREYQVNILHIDDSPPDCEFNLNKKQAYTRWSEIIRQDVLELND